MSSRTVYNINLGIGEASSGVEYAQAYRHNILQGLDVNQKYLFLDFQPMRDIRSLVENIGIWSSNMLWLYDYVLGYRTEKSTMTLEDFQAFLPGTIDYLEDSVKIYTSDTSYARIYYLNKDKGIFNRVEYVESGLLVRKDYYSGKLVYCSEYYTPVDNVAVCVRRDLFSLTGSLVATEVLESEDNSSFFFSDGKYYLSKQDLFYQWLKSLDIKPFDWVLLDRSTGTGQAVFSLKSEIGFYLGVVVHADHWLESESTETSIFWNNYYEYQFRNAELVDTFICSTTRQSELLKKHLSRYFNKAIKVRTIPVGYLGDIKSNKVGKGEYRFVTASRLSSEKNIDLAIKAFSKSLRETNLDMSFHIYGEGSERENLQNLINDLNLQNRVVLMGHKDLSQVYRNYNYYLTASQSEGFGLSLLEAVGSGLYLVGYNVPYGNQEFSEDGRNGYLVDYSGSIDDKVTNLAEGITYVTRKGLIQTSKQQIKKYLKKNVIKEWKGLLWNY